jgi:purine-binding chemotaxis protein CheW
MLRKGVNEMDMQNNDQTAVAQMTAEDEDTVGLTPEEVEASKKEKASVIDFKMVTFSLAGKDYAVDIMKVKEIAKAGRFTYVPNTLPFVLGVYNLRGEIIPIIDLRLFFNIDVPERQDNAIENMLIVTVGEQTFGVVVDAIDKVVGIQKSTIQPPHPLFGDINIKYIYGVVEANKHLYILLDIDRIFGARNAEEEKELVEQTESQIQDPNAGRAVRNNISVQNGPVAPAVTQKAPVAESKAAVTEKTEDVDFGFVENSLKNFKKFTVNEITQSWTKKRYASWVQERGKDKTQLQNESDAESFLAPFYSPCTGTWWTEEYANLVYKALPDNAAKTIVVWNPGCGKGYESFSLACLLKKRYPDARIRLYAHDIDLLNVSNAPLMTVSEEAAGDWYAPYVTKTVTGEYTFSKEIKDMIMFEYHDCVNTNALPPLDIVFVRDVISFLAPEAQKTVLADFDEKVKGNGLLVFGENEEPVLQGWSKKLIGTLPVYTKQ